MTRSILARASAVAVLAIAVFAGPASAHVLVDSVRPLGDGSVDIRFAFNHGCSGGEATTRLIVTLPRNVTYLRSEPPSGWSATVESSVVTFSGPAIPNEDEAAFGITALVTAEPGTAVLLPTIQECGTTARYEWTGVTNDAEEPAPRFIATAATATAPPARPVAADSGPGTMQLALVAAGFVAVAALATGTLSRRRMRR